MWYIYNLSCIIHARLFFLSVGIIIRYRGGSVIRRTQPWIPLGRILMLTARRVISVMHATTSSLPNHSLYFLLIRTENPGVVFGWCRAPVRTRLSWVNPAVRETCENVCFWWDISRPFPFNWSPWNVGTYMCSVDRRWYQDGGFNGQWTSQLAPFQCSGTLLFPPFLHFSPLSSLFLLRYSSFYIRPSDIISSYVYLVCFLSSSFHRRPKSSISRFPSSFSLPLRSFGFSSRVKLPVYMRSGRLPGWSGTLRAPLSPLSDTGTQKIRILSYPRGSL